MRRKIGCIIGFVLVSVIVFSISGIAEETEKLKKIHCEKETPELCMTLYDPVCADDGETYSNGCVACTNEEIKWYTMGEC